MTWNGIEGHLAVLCCVIVSLDLPSAQGQSEYHCCIVAECSYACDKSSFAVLWIIFHQRKKERLEFIHCQRVSSVQAMPPSKTRCNQYVCAKNVPLLKLFQMTAEMTAK